MGSALRSVAWSGGLLLAVACGATSMPVAAPTTSATLSGVEAPSGDVQPTLSTTTVPSTVRSSTTVSRSTTVSPAVSPSTTVLPTTTMVPPTTTTVPSMSTTTGPAAARRVDQVLRSPTALEPLRVMVIGDSVTYEIEPGLTAALQHTGLVVSANRTQMGFGLSQWPIFHWWEIWEPFLEEVRPEAVVVQTGIWDVQAVHGGERRRPRPEDPDWEAQFAFLVGVALDVLTADGAHVYWLTMLPSPEAGQSERLNRLLADLAGGDDRMSLVDLTPGFTDTEGSYVQYVDRHGAAWPVRKVDGTHICREGAEVVAEITAAAILADAGLDLVAGWENDPWRSDPLYEVDPCEDPAPLG